MIKCMACEDGVPLFLDKIDGSQIDHFMWPYHLVPIGRMEPYPYISLGHLSGGKCVVCLCLNATCWVRPEQVKDRVG